MFLDGCECRYGGTVAVSDPAAGDSRAYITVNHALHAGHTALSDAHQT